MPKKTKKRGKFVPKPKVANDESSVSAPICNDAVEVIEPPVKSYRDDNNYRIIKLANGLTAVLVSCIANDYSKESYSSMQDKKKAGSRDDDEFSLTNMENPGWCQRMKEKKHVITKEAYFELCVNVGSYHDPRQVPGASRLLSRFILQKSKKYSGSDDNFGDWLWRRAGYEFVHDDGEKTVYTFETKLKYLTEALDRFSQSFIYPLLSPTAITRLRNDLVSEYEANLRDEEKMTKEEKQHLFNNLVSANHSARAYGRNYLKGLSLPNDDKVYKEVIKFRERHYSAHRMTIVLKAELSLETLEAYIKEYFSKIPNNGLPLSEFDQYNFMNSFEESKYGRLYKLNSYAQKDISEFDMFSVTRPSKRIELTWSMPPSQWLYRTKPERYLAWLIAHEGKGSLINYLRKQKLCTRIDSGVGDKEFEDNSIYTLFSLSLTLTDEGRKNYRKVLDTIFSYFTLLRRAGLQPKLYEELRLIEENRFRYLHDLDFDDDVKRLSVHMLLYPPADYLTGQHLYFEYDSVSISTYMKLMSPERANIIIYEETSEPIQSEFPSEKIPEEWLESWENAKPFSDFKLPEPNVYCADDFTLISVTENTPRSPLKILSNKMCEIWYGIGTELRLPMCYINFFFMSPLPLASAENYSMTDMLSIILQNILNEELYAARAAGMTFKFSRSRDEGILLEISSFSQKLPLLMGSIAKLIRDCSIFVTKDLFESIKKQLLTAYEDRILGKHITDTLAEDLRLAILKVVHWTRMAKHAALLKIKLNQFQEYVKRFTDHVYIKCLAQGNITSEDVLANVQQFMKISKFGPLMPNMRPQLRMHEIPTGAVYCRVQSFVKESKSVTVKNYYQCGGHSTRALVMIDLLTSIIEDDTFEELRECKEIDSIEYSTTFMWSDNGVAGYSIEMSEDNKVSKPKSTQHLDMEIEMLRRCLYSLFDEMTDKEWRDVLDIFMDRKKLPTGSKKLENELHWNWGEIIAGTYVFNKTEQEMIELKKLTIADIRKWMLYLTTSGNNIRKISIQVDCGGSTEPASNSERKYELKYLSVVVPTGTKGKRHRYIDCITYFNRTLKILPIPDKA